MPSSAGEASARARRPSAGAPPGRLPLRAAGGGAALLALLLLVLYGATFPARLYGDDVFFVWCIVRERAFPLHFLFLPAARAATWLGAHAGLDPFLVLRLLSASGVAAAGGLLLAAARRLGAFGPLALASALLVATAPSAWFFATAAEIHGPHLGAVALLAWVLAGTRPASSPGRTLAAALAFGLVVGTHQTGALLLPGAVLLHLLLTRGRARRRRLADLAALAAGGALSLAAMLAFRRLEGAGAPPAAGLDLLALKLSAGLDPGRIASWLATDAVAPAPALALLGAFGAATLARRRPLVLAVLAAVLVPYLVFFALWGYVEAGAYLLPTLPALAAAAVLGPTLEGRAHLRATPAAGAWALGLVLAAALALAPLAVVPRSGHGARESEALRLLGEGPLLALAAGALLLGLVLPSPRLRARRVAAGALAIVLAQSVGALRGLARFDREQPLLAWGRDVVTAIGGEGSVLVLTGFEEKALLELLAEPWPEPWAGTWDYQASLPRPAPVPYDVAELGPAAPDTIDALAREGRRIHLLRVGEEVPDVPEAFGKHPRIGPILREVLRRSDLVPVDHGSFAGWRLVPRGAAAEETEGRAPSDS